MKPIIDSTSFGNIVISGIIYEHDVVIRLNGEVKKRKKKLSKEQYGTSHKVSLSEAKHIYNDGAKAVIIGTGQYGVLKLSDEAVAYFRKKNCLLKLLPTPEAMVEWNSSEGAVIGMFHVTC